MIYSNPEFLILFTLTLGIYSLFKKQNIRVYILILSSFFFYAWAGVFDTLIFLFVLIVSWGAAFLGLKYTKYKKPLLLFGIAVMVIHLCYWKYAAWMTSQVQLIFPKFLNGKKLTLPLPIGISFFTLQGIAYLADLYRGQAIFIDFKKYVLFKSFFPQLVAGPIVRAKQLVPQLDRLQSPTSEGIVSGLALFVMGFFKKIFIADRIAPFADSIFSNPHDFNRWTLTMGILSYAVQIWGDFSGYTDMGRGCAKMLGITLPENFLSPYLSQSPSEFWKRWHITLSQWIRDYIYIPLGGGRGGVLKSTAVVLATMSISGLWHGASWTFILWGLYHGLLLWIERLWGKVSIWSPMEGIAARVTVRVLNTIGTFIAVCFGWLLFRAQSIGAFKAYLESFVHPGSQVQIHNLSNTYANLIICFVLQTVFYFSFSQNRRPLLEVFEEQIMPRAVSSAILCGGLLAMIFVGTIIMRHSNYSSAFIYFQF